MSIWASLPAPNDDHADGCGIWESMTDGFLLPHECTCGLRHAPLTYWGANNWPSSAGGDRHGSVDIAAAMPDGRPLPFLRLSVFGSGNAHAVVLEPAHVEQIVETLTGWLDRVRCGGCGGRGTVLCESCNGSGMRGPEGGTCSECGGNGGLPCPECGREEA